MSSSLSCLPSLRNMTPRYLNFSAAEDLLHLFGKSTGQGCLDMHIISVLAILIFISASKHASENRSNTFWKLLLIEHSNAKSSANSRRQTLHSQNVTPLLQKLPLSILSMYTIKKEEKERSPVVVQH